MTRIELEACDTNFTGLVLASFYRIGAKESSKTTLATVSTGGTPGCNFFVKDLAVPHTIDNRNNTYLMFVDVFPNEPISPNTRFRRCVSSMTCR